MSMNPLNNRPKRKDIPVAESFKAIRDKRPMRQKPIKCVCGHERHIEGGNLCLTTYCPCTRFCPIPTRKKRKGVGNGI